LEEFQGRHHAKRHNVICYFHENPEHYPLPYSEEFQLHSKEDILDRSLESLEKDELTEEENIKCIIRNGATINAQNVEGESPLFMARNTEHNAVLCFGQSRTD
jgi:hypothetical protein